MPDLLLGIDIGTTATKAVLIDNRGHQLADCSRPVRLMSSQAGQAEEDAQQWWRNVCDIIPELLVKAGAYAIQVAAVGVSGMVPAVVLLDSAEHVLRPSIQQNDARAVAEIADQCSATNASDILARTGSAITQQSVGPKLLWLRHHEAGLMRHVAHVMGSYDYIVHCLTGNFSIERNWALESGLFDLVKQDWDDDLLKMSEADRAWLGRVNQPTDVVGLVNIHAALQTGLLPGTPVVAGSADHIASALSAGIKNENDLLIKLGGSGDILCCTGQAEMDARLYLDYHDIPGKFILNGCMAASGSLIRWFRDQFGSGLDFKELDAEAEKLPAGADGLVLLPYFLGEKTPLNDPMARGTVVGLTLSHTRAHLYRAVLEGISYGFYHHLAALADHNHQFAAARVTNGGAHSLLWRQVTADVLGLRLEEIAHHPGSSLGAAFVAGMGVGAFREWSEVEKFIEIASITVPDPKKHARYMELFKIYRQIYENLKEIYPVLANAAGSSLD
jgi:xylulokinase